MRDRCKHRVEIALGRSSVIERCYKELGHEGNHDVYAVHHGKIFTYEWSTGDEWEVEED